MGIAHVARQLLLEQEDFLADIALELFFGDVILQAGILYLLKTFSSPRCQKIVNHVVKICKPSV